MRNEYFEITKMVLQIILLCLSVFLIPKIQKYITENTNKEQRENTLFWIKYAVRIAEDIYKEKGQGKLKKEYVVAWLDAKGIHLSQEQLDVLIDMVVQYYNKIDWRFE